jgi:hypothetical protein
MSVAFFIVVNTDDPTIDSFVEGKALAQQAPKLADIAKQVGLEPLEHYVSQDLGDILDDVDIARNEESIWFSAAEGITWVQTMSNYIQANPRHVDDGGAVLEDLQDYLRVFKQLDALGYTWHLEIDM